MHSNSLPYRFASRCKAPRGDICPLCLVRIRRAVKLRVTAYHSGLDASGPLGTARSQGLAGDVGPYWPSTLIERRRSSVFNSASSRIGSGSRRGEGREYATACSEKNTEVSSCSVGFPVPCFLGLQVTLIVRFCTCSREASAKRPKTTAVFWVAWRPLQVMLFRKCCQTLIN